MQLQQRRLLLLAVPDCVHAELPQHQRPLLCEILEARKVGPQIRPTVEVDVVGKEIRLLGKKILRRGKIGVGGQRPRILVFHQPHEGVQKRLHPLRPVPANQVRGNLVVHVVAEDRGMTGLALRRPANARPDLLPHRPIVQKENPPLPRHRHHHPQAVLRRRVEEPAGRRMVHAHGVEARRGDQPEVPRRLRRIAQMIIPIPERTVSHPLQKKLRVPGEEEFPPGHDPRPAQGRGLRLRLRGRQIRKQRDRGLAHSRS